MPELPQGGSGISALLLETAKRIGEFVAAIFHLESSISKLKAQNKQLNQQVLDLQEKVRDLHVKVGELTSRLSGFIQGLQVGSDRIPKLKGRKSEDDG